MKNLSVIPILIPLAFAAAACGADVSESTATGELAMAEMFPSISEIQPGEWEALSSRRIFFGHKSVGRNIMAGVRRVVERHPEIRLHVVSTDAPESVDGPAFIDGEIGQNRHPETKDAAFSAVLERGFGSEPGAVAMYKYCYVDVQPDTDPEQLFRRYVEQIEEVRTRYPLLTIVHFTLPLHQAGTGWVDRLKTRFGQPTQTALNIKRNRFNELLREQYGETDPVFDLALIESTRADGSRAYSEYAGERVFMLAPEWTYDGGHLTDEAQDMVAERLLVFLAGLESRRHRPELADSAPRGR